MAKVKLFGIYSTKVEKDNLIIEAKNIEELLTKLTELEPKLGLKELKRSLIFVNNRNITELDMFKTKINHEDSISILSPVAGG
jgi:molybdopterin converting factor small subunit